MNVIVDLRHEYKDKGAVKTEFLVKVYEDDEKNVVLFTDLGIGKSVTAIPNQLPYIAIPHITREAVLFFETYQWKLDRNRDDCYAEVIYTRDGYKFVHQTWRPIKNAEFLELIGK